MRQKKIVLIASFPTLQKTVPKFFRETTGKGTFSTGSFRQTRPAAAQTTVGQTPSGTVQAAVEKTRQGAAQATEDVTDRCTTDIHSKVQ
jgi:hypothetical protein